MPEACSGCRPVGLFLQRASLRHADGPAVGALHLAASPAAPLPPGPVLPSRLPLRIGVEPPRLRRPSREPSALGAGGGGALPLLPRLVLLWPGLGRGNPDGPAHARVVPGLAARGPGRRLAHALRGPPAPQAGAGRVTRSRRYGRET